MLGFQNLLLFIQEHLCVSPPAFLTISRCKKFPNLNLIYLFVSLNLISFASVIFYCICYCCKYLSCRQAGRTAWTVKDTRPFNFVNSKKAEKSMCLCSLKFYLTPLSSKEYRRDASLDECLTASVELLLPSKVLKKSWEHSLVQSNGREARICFPTKRISQTFLRIPPSIFFTRRILLRN